MGLLVSEMKKNDEIKNSIVEMVRRLNPTKAALCKKHGITWNTLKNWREDDTEFDKAYKSAVKDYLNEINISARKSLGKLVKGYSYNEEKTVYISGPDGEPVILQKTITKKHVQPNPTAVTYALSNLEPENFE